MDSSSIDNWELSSPKPHTTHSGRDQYRHHRLRTDSLSPEQVPKSSSVTVTSDNDDTVNLKHSLRRPKHKSFSKRLSCDEDDDNDNDRAVPSTEIMSSLNKINSQLGEVLTRLAQQSSVTTSSSIQPTPYPSADPLLHVRKPDKTEEELRNKWLYYLGK